MYGTSRATGLSHEVSTAQQQALMRWNHVCAHCHNPCRPLSHTHSPSLTHKQAVVHDTQSSQEGCVRPQRTLHHTQQALVNKQRGLHTRSSASHMMVMVVCWFNQEDDKATCTEQATEGRCKDMCIRMSWPVVMNPYNTTDSAGVPISHQGPRCNSAAAAAGPLASPAGWLASSCHPGAPHVHPGGWLQHQH